MHHRHSGLVLAVRVAKNWAFLLGLVAALDGVLFSSSAPADMPAPARPERGKPFEVQEVRDLAYVEGDKADKVKHKLDLYLPRGRTDFPVLFFVHGGAWVHGDKAFLGIYRGLGTMLARQGVGAVVINYRLAPLALNGDQGQPLDHIQDVAKAFAWTHRHIKDYGGRPDQLFVCGHSAGGHLVSLLATDASYLQAEGLSPQAIKGVIPISGVYCLTTDDVAALVLGKDSRPGQVAGPLFPRKVPDGLNPFTMVFGNDSEVLKKASPLTHVRRGLPPFLIVYVEYDLLALDKMAEEFCKALLDHKCEAQALKIHKRFHFDVIYWAAHEGDALAKALLGFIARHTRQ